MQVTNSTGEVLHLTNASRSGLNAHWDSQPVVDLHPGYTETVSAYSAGNAQINLTYTAAALNTTLQMSAETPLVGSNSVDASVTGSNSYTVNSQAGSGYTPTDTFVVVPGHSFTYAGQTEQYVVPPGVSQLNVRATGGSSQGAGDAKPVVGAKVTGVLAVVPGETLTVGVGGEGGDASNNVAGGWGPTFADNDYSGGDGTAGADTSGAGGGATVITDATGSVMVVAGGGGGYGAECGNGSYRGGRGGTSWTGENGTPYPGGGGKAGANTDTAGQSQTSSAGLCTAGAGGGGVQGGQVGISGNGSGGGAGSSAAPGLTGSAVAPAGLLADYQNTGGLVLSVV